jgi:SAM-dependent methyltransferase
MSEVLVPGHSAGTAHLGARYGATMQSALYERLLPYLHDGVRILDVGGGRSPFLPADMRPDGTRYVGTDIDAEELDSAPAGAYDDSFLWDVTEPAPVSERFDVLLSWQVLEHVGSMERALANQRELLVPGGVLFAQLTGARALFALLTRILPLKLRVSLMVRLLDHHEEDHFPTRYDHCRRTDLVRLLEGWSSAEVVPYYRGAHYFDFPGARDAYLVYENAIARRSAADFATHYLIIARR